MAHSHYTGMARGGGKDLMSISCRNVYTGPRQHTGSRLAQDSLSNIAPVPVPAPCSVNKPLRCFLLPFNTEAY